MLQEEFNQSKKALIDTLAGAGYLVTEIRNEVDSAGYTKDDILVLRVVKEPKDKGRQ